MTHEPECPEAQCQCLAHGWPCTCPPCVCNALRRAYRRGFTEGFNQHARAAQHWQATHGAYRQHGQGENP